MSLDNLIQRADDYDEWIMIKFGSLKSFYKRCLDPVLGTEYNDKHKQTVSSLKFIGSGQCCYVYHAEGDTHVLKLHYPFNQHIDLRAEPTIEIYDNLKKNPDIEDKDIHYFDREMIPHFLFYDHISNNGLAGVQKKVDCSEDSQVKAYEMFRNINPRFAKWNHFRNCGMNGETPVYVDWN